MGVSSTVRPKKISITRDRNLIFADYEIPSSSSESEDRYENLKENISQNLSIFLRRRDKFAMKLKEIIPDLKYLKFAFNGQNLKKFQYKKQIIHNIIDIYFLKRKSLKFDRFYDFCCFENLIQKNMHEYNFAEEEELKFESNYQGGNLFLAIRVKKSN